MPELPEVETTRRGLEPALAGQRFTAVTVRNRNLRQRVPERLAERLTGATVTRLERRAKYILARLVTSGGDHDTLVLHLGMSGNLTVTEHGVEPDAKRSKSAVTGGGYAYRKHDHVVFATEHATITFNDPRRFGLVLLIPTHQVEEHDLFRHLGPEPLSDDFTATILRQKLHNKKIALKVALMDQRTVVGVGNIYASEALFRAKLNPKLPAGKLTQKQATELVKQIKAVLNDAIEAGGSSLRDYRHGSGELGYFQYKLNVYDHKGDPCPVCQTPIKHAVLGQRSTYWCPTCQKA